MSSRVLLGWKKISEIRISFIKSVFNAISLLVCPPFQSSPKYSETLLHLSVIQKLHNNVTKSKFNQLLKYRETKIM